MEKLQFGRYYHIYNCGNNHQDLFLSQVNYQHFIEAYGKYINPIADTYAWVLMKNHFHLLVRIKEIDEIGFYKLLKSNRSDDPAKFQTTAISKITKSEKQEMIKRPDPSRHFSHLFNAYTKYFNTVFQRSGSLFERPFRRIEVTHECYFKHLVIYIHNNPVHHGFIDDFKDYPWSSYGSIISIKPTRLSRETVLGWFDSKANFVDSHRSKINIECINDLKME